MLKKICNHLELLKAQPSDGESAAGRAKMARDVALVTEVGVCPLRSYPCSSIACPSVFRHWQRVFLIRGLGWIPLGNSLPFVRRRESLPTLRSSRVRTAPS